jgi:hypothetical protein
MPRFSCSTTPPCAHADQARFCALRLASESRSGGRSVDDDSRGMGGNRRRRRRPRRAAGRVERVVALGVPAVERLRFRIGIQIRRNKVKQFVSKTSVFEGGKP